MTRFTQLSDIIQISNTGHALLITNRKDIDAGKDLILAQSETKEVKYNVTATQQPQGLKKEYAIYFLSEYTTSN